MKAYRKFRCEIGAQQRVFCGISVAFISLQDFRVQKHFSPVPSSSVCNYRLAAVSFQYICVSVPAYIFCVNGMTSQGLPYSQLGAAAAKRVKHTFILLLLSTRDRKMAAVQHKLTRREKGSTRLVQEEKTEALMNQPDICRRIRRCLAQQAGNGLSFLPLVGCCRRVSWAEPGASCSTPVLYQLVKSFLLSYLNPMLILTATTSRLI